MTIKPVGAVVEVWDGQLRWRMSRTKIVPVDQLLFVMKQLSEQTAAWCKHSFELRSITLCRHDEAMAEIERLQAENATLRQKLAETRNKALDEAAASVEAVAHEGLHASMWRNKFEQVAETIRLMKVGTP